MTQRHHPCKLCSCHVLSRNHNSTFFRKYMGRLLSPCLNLNCVECYCLCSSWSRVIPVLRHFVGFIEVMRLKTVLPLENRKFPIKYILPVEDTLKYTTRIETGHW